MQPPEPQGQALSDERLREMAQDECGDCISKPCPYCARLVKFGQRVLRELQQRRAAPDVRALAAEMYQVAGALDAPVRVLDKLSAIASGNPVPDVPILPVIGPAPAQGPAEVIRDGNVLPAQRRGAQAPGCGEGGGMSTQKPDPQASVLSDERLREMAQDECGDCISKPCPYCARLVKFGQRVRRELQQRRAAQGEPQAKPCPECGYASPYRDCGCQPSPQGPAALVREKLGVIHLLADAGSSWAKDCTRQRIRTLAREALDALKEPPNGR